MTNNNKQKIGFFSLLEKIYIVSIFYNCCKKGGWTHNIRLASPAERWGGFGTCVQNKTTGQRKSAQLPVKAHPPSYNTTTASWAKATHRTSTSTRKASRQSQINTTHRSPAKPSQGRVTPTPSTYDLDQRAPSHGPKSLTIARRLGSRNPTAP